MAKRGRRARAGRGAFTLIELLVVVAIIAMLMSILLPSLKAARESARTVVCGQRQRDLGTGMQTYFSENNDWIPGVNTSGVALRSVEGMLDEYFNPRVPVQSFDWVTPIMSPSMEMPGLRADRFADIINKFACASQRFNQSIIWPGASIPGEEDHFEQVGTWTSVSYLMPVYFQFYGSDYEDFVLGTHVLNPSYKIVAHTPFDFWSVTMKSYKPKVTMVGDAARKIACADGTRYLAEDMLDFDPSPAPTYFGSFTSAGAWWCGSTAYGVKSGSKNWSGRAVSAGGDPPGQGRNLALSYRHGNLSGGETADTNSGKMNALFFDGSVRTLNDKQSRNPILWYPKGSRVNGNAWREGMIDDLGSNDLIP